MDPSDSHQHEGVTAQNISPVTTPTLNELNRVEAQVEPQVQPEAQPQAPSEAALVPAQPSSNQRLYTDVSLDLKCFFFQINYVWSFGQNLLTYYLYADDLRCG